MSFLFFGVGILKALIYIIKTLSILSPRLGFSLTKLLVSFPRHLSAKARDLKTIEQAKVIEFKRNGKKVALSWGQGPVVILFHGWEGRSTQMAPIAQKLASQGYQAIALDFTGHGESQGRQCRFDDLIADVAALHDYVLEHISPEVHAMVGHSAGGVCMMESRLRHNIKVNNFVVVSSPSAPYPAIEALRKNLKVPQNILNLVQASIAQSFQTDWPTMLAGKVYTARHNNERLLLVYDESDKIISHTDGDKIAGIFPQSSLIKTQGFGHTKVLWNALVIEKVCDFICQGLLVCPSRYGTIQGKSTRN